MSLATRCTACGTVFRIVEDQLRVSDGWVRCGRCAEIFDARELLFDIEQEAPPPWPAAFTPEPVMEPPPPPPPPAEPVWMPPPEPEPRADALPTGWPSEVARREPRWVEAEGVAEAAEPQPLPEQTLDPSPPKAVEPSSAPPTVIPDFMRRAESTARWNRPRVRIVLSLVSVLLALLLALQVTLHFRDALAALHPPLRGGLQTLCRAFGCEIQPWRRIEALSIESTSLNPVGSSGGYKLNLSLRNKTGVDVAAPWVELSLTDASGAPFARRVVEPAALSPPLNQVGAESEQGLSFSFSTGGQRASGYSVNVFYP